VAFAGRPAVESSGSCRKFVEHVAAIGKRLHQLVHRRDADRALARVRRDAVRQLGGHRDHAILAHRETASIGEREFDARPALGDDRLSLVQPVSGLQLAHTAVEPAREHGAGDGLDGGDFNGRRHQ